MAKTDKLKTLIPMEELEYEAQSQIYNALELDFLIKLAIMPDCHTGYSLPIGGVALLDNVISPAYVGYDIGCGMCCIITDVDSKDLDQREKVHIFEQIIKRIPTGVSVRQHGLTYPLFRSGSGNPALEKSVNDKIGKQLGTLGGGNHFIEIGETRSQPAKIVITLHSGSRKAGHEICTFHTGVSNLCDKDLPNGFLRLDSDFGKAYLKDMIYAQDYALENRKQMMLEILDIMKLPKTLKNMINENHNHAIVNGSHVLHRKGATPADKGQLGVIPGNMKDGVYITKGLGNEEYLSSASHGAGRKMARGKAAKNLDFNYFKNQMKGIVAVVDENILDESPDAYKDLEMVVSKQVGTVVEVVEKAYPLINVKASEESHSKRRKKKKEERRRREEQEKDIW